MRTFQLVGAVLAFVVCFFVSRIVLHAFTDHGHLDLFHLVVALTVGIGGVLLLYRAFARSPRMASPLDGTPS